MNARKPAPVVSPLRVFGAMLRHYRTRAGLSQEQLGSLLYCSGDTVSKIEAGQRAPSEQFAQACERIPDLKTGGALLELRVVLEDYLKQRAYPGWFHRWPEYESRATTLRTFELVAIPGLLQTEDYARVMLRTHVMATDEEVDEMVAARLERQVLLTREKPPMFWVLLDESLLRRPVGSSEIMAGQLRHLIECAARPNIVIQIIPATIGAHPGMSGNFVLADFADAPSVAYQDTAARGQVLEDSDDLGVISLLWDTLNSEALPRSASVGLMKEVLAAWT